MTMSAPSLRARCAASIAVATVGVNTQSPEFDTSGVVSWATGTIATFNPPISLTTVPTRPGTGEPSASVRLTAPQGYLDCSTRCRNASVPKSNSWLPGTARSNGITLVSSTMLAPLSSPDISDGDSMSPSNT